MIVGTSAMLLGDEPVDMKDIKNVKTYTLRIVYLFFFVSIVLAFFGFAA